MDPIVSGLWLGSRPDNRDLPRLKNLGIKAIVTVDTSPLDELAFMSFNRLFIYATDDPFENLLSSFEEAVKFIDENRADGVLVHW